MRDTRDSRERKYNESAIKPAHLRVRKRLMVEFLSDLKNGAYIYSLNSKYHNDYVKRTNIHQVIHSTRAKFRESKLSPSDSSSMNMTFTNFHVVIYER